jgi:stage II sporulation protein D
MNVKQSIIDCFHAFKGGCPIIALKKFLILLAWIMLSLTLYWCGYKYEVTKDLSQTKQTLEQMENQTEEVNNPIDENIRVLIKTDNYEDIYHSEVCLVSESGMNVDVDGTVFTISAGEEYRVYKGMDYERVIMSTSSDVDGDTRNGKIHFKNLKRNSNALYAGRLELIFTDMGIVVINELPIEDYLCGVIPSEMPSNYPLEAIKAQAVSARTYTYFHMKDYAYPEWNAHIDDSTTYQVYMNNAADDKSTSAVMETQGLVLTYNNEIVESFYYSTSGGYNGALAVWNSSADTDVIQAVSDSYLIEMGNELFATNTMVGEKAYKTYIDEGDSADVEYDEAWYRWTYDKTINETDLHNIFEFIYNQSKSQTENIEIKSDTKTPENLIYESKITGIKVLNRQKSGLVTTLLIETPNYEITLTTQYIIRQILGSLGGKVVRKDNTEYTLNNMLPSAYFYIEYTPNEITSHLKIKGAGFGHGCGLSQNGAKNLAEAGYTYDEIIGYYYNAEIEMRQ